MDHGSVIRQKITLYYLPFVFLMLTLNIPAKDICPPQKTNVAKKLMRIAVVKILDKIKNSF